MKRMRRWFLIFCLFLISKQSIYATENAIVTNKEIVYNDEVKAKIELIDRLHRGLPICVCKTPMSITDNEKLLGFPKDFTMTITDIKVYNGAGYIVLYMGNVLTMPGLAKESNYLKEVYNG